MRKKKRPETFIESHGTCRWAKGNTCRFWGCSHRELYRETETEQGYDDYMAHSKCSNYKRPKT